MLHPPHGNRPTAVFLPTVPDLLIPAYPFVPVEDNEMPLAHITAAVHIPYRLLQAFSDGLVQIATLDFQFQHNALHRPPVTVRQGLADQQIRTAAAQSVLPVDVPTTIHHTLQECLQQQLRAALLVVETLDPRIRILTEKLLEIQK